MRLIDADALKEALVLIIIPEMKRYRDRYKLLNILNKLNVAISEAIDEVPTIDMESLQSQWIPVTERLPDVCRDEKGVLIPFLVSGAGGKYHSIAVYNNGIWSAGLFRVDVTAWMPLPSVYKPKDKEE